MGNVACDWRCGAGQREGQKQVLRRLVQIGRILRAGLLVLAVLLLSANEVPVWAASMVATRTVETHAMTMPCTDQAAPATPATHRPCDAPGHHGLAGCTAGCDVTTTVLPTTYRIVQTSRVLVVPYLARPNE